MIFFLVSDLNKNYLYNKTMYCKTPDLPFILLLSINRKFWLFRSFQITESRRALFKVESCQIKVSFSLCFVSLLTSNLFILCAFYTFVYFMPSILFWFSQRSWKH